MPDSFWAPCAASGAMVALEARNAARGCRLLRHGACGGFLAWTVMWPRPALPLRRLLLLAIFLWPLSATAVEWVGTVVGIADGDTLTLLDAGKNDTPHPHRWHRRARANPALRPARAPVARGSRARPQCARRMPEVAPLWSRGVPRARRRRRCRPRAGAARTGLALRQVRARTVVAGPPRLFAGGGAGAQLAQWPVDGRSAHPALGLPARAGGAHRRPIGRQPARPTICAVAISSSSIAIEARPETVKGSSTGLSEYFSSSDGLTLVRLTWPIVQPAKWRSGTSA